MSERRREPINASNIGLYIGFEECPRYLKQSIGGSNGNEDELGVFLSEAGEQFEEEILDGLQDDAAMFIDADKCGEWDLPDDYSEALTVIQQNFEDIADNVGEEGFVLVYQPSLWGQIDAWPIKGQADLLALWCEDGTLRAHVLEIKSSTETQPYHQIQAAIYTHRD